MPAFALLVEALRYREPQRTRTVDKCLLQNRIGAKIVLKRLESLTWTD
jgi:hypothetical protein